MSCREGLAWRCGDRVRRLCSRYAPPIAAAERRTPFRWNRMRRHSLTAQCLPRAQLIDFCPCFAPGFFQPESAQSTCIPCNTIGDSFYQSERGQTVCSSCAAHTKIFNRIYTDPGECQCRAGQLSENYARIILRATSLHASPHQAFCLGRDHGPSPSAHGIISSDAGWYHNASATGQVPANAFALLGLGCTFTVSPEKMFISHAGVQAMYERGPRRLTIRFLVRPVCLA